MSDETDTKEHNAIIHFAPVININLEKLGDEERALVSLMVRDVLSLLSKFAEKEE